MLNKIINLLLKPYSLAKTKVYLFSLLTAIFLGNLLYIKLSLRQNILEVFSENSTPTYLAIGILVVFFYMIFVDSNDSKRKSEIKREVLEILSNPSVSDNIKEKLIEKMDDNI